MTGRTGRCLLDAEQRNTIRLVHPADEGRTVPFHIQGLTAGGEGGSAVCYVARCGRKWGTLKEFYPLDPVTGLPFLHRDEEGQLRPRPGGEQRFYALCLDFVRAYDVLEELKAANRVLTTFFPSCEIFWGRTADGGRGSVYIWTADDKQGESFETCLQRVRQAPEAEAPRKLYDVVATLITLTDCIRQLHSAGVLHLDLKPGNFLVAYDGENHINTHSISLFDVNSICLADGAVRSRGTPGFRAPETAAGRGDNRSDLFSIGAILFYGAVIVPELPAPQYSAACYDRLEDLVRDSRLIGASAANSGPVVRYLLTRILKKCLHADPRHRYEDCEELLEDLQRLRAHLLPEVFGRGLGGGRRMVIREERIAGDGVGAMQELLYRRPLFEALPADQKDLRILVLGGDRFGQKFVDLCLQTGQIPGRRLQVQVASKDPELDREIYLHYRPELTRFVRVAGGPECPEPWAELEFCPLTADCGPLIHGGCHYIFVSLGDDRQNEQTAAALGRLTRHRIPVAYISRTGTAPADPALIPVKVGQKVRWPRDLERMAFNVHLCWKDQNDLDLRQARTEFRRQYYYHASMANALAVPYKLYGLGLRADDPAAVSEKLAHRQTGSFRALVALEHRRWVLEKVTAGWTLPRDKQGQPDYAGCALRGQTADKRRRRHLCLVHSTPDTPLSGPFPWDTPSPADDQLDPLDRMSVELHRQYQRMSRSLRTAEGLRCADVVALQNLSRRAGEPAAEACRRYVACLQGALDGSRTDTRALPRYEAALLDALGPLAGEGRQRLELVRRRFRPVTEANLRRNYKQNDELMVERIPFILTNRPGTPLITAFSRTDPVANVAPALVLRPEKLTYLLYLEPMEGAHLQRALTPTLECLRRRRIAGKVCFLVAGPGAETAAPVFGTLRSQGILADYRLLPAANASAAARKMAAAMKGRRRCLLDATTPVFGDEDAQAVFDAATALPRFRYEGRRFLPGPGCEELAYLRTDVRLEPAELLLLLGDGRLTPDQPDPRQDHAALWNVFTQAGPALWDETCRRLRCHLDMQERLAVLDPQARPWQRYGWYFPAEGCDAVCRLADRLRRRGILGPDGAVYSAGRDLCRMEADMGDANAAALEDLLSRHSLLTGGETLEFAEENGSVAVYGRGLEVRDLPAAEPALLKELGRTGLLTALRFRDETCSFAFAARSIRKLLTDPAALPLAQLLHSAMASGRFDGGCPILRQGREQCLLTAGTEGLTVAYAQGHWRLRRLRDGAEKDLPVADMSDLMAEIVDFLNRSVDEYDG